MDKKNDPPTPNLNVEVRDGGQKIFQWTVHFNIEIGGGGSFFLSIYGVHVKVCPYIYDLMLSLLYS